MLYVNAAVQPLYTATVRIAFAILYLLAVLNDFRDFCLCIVYYVLYNLLLLVVLPLLLLLASMLIHLLLFLIATISIVSGSVTITYSYNHTTITEAEQI